MPSTCRVEPAHADGVNLLAPLLQRHYRGARPRQLDLLKLRTKRASQALALVVRHRQQHPYNTSSLAIHCNTAPQSSLLYTATKTPYPIPSLELEPTLRRANPSRRPSRFSSTPTTSATDLHGRNHILYPPCQKHHPYWNATIRVMLAPSQRSLGV